MRRKILFGVDYTDSELIKLLLYLFVGGTAALVEWALFYIFFHYILAGLSLTLLTMLATALSFCLATLAKDGSTKPNTFRVCFIDPFQGTVGANFVTNELKAKKAALYIDNSSDYSKVCIFLQISFFDNNAAAVSGEGFFEEVS